MKRAKKAALQPPASARRVPAPGPKGRARIQTILAAAKTVLIEKDYTHFSLRNIAASAGMHLANLQYYFPTRDEVIHALVGYIVHEYDSKYQARFATLPEMPYPRFVAVLDFLIEDIRDPQTRRFFVQLWGLLESSDTSGRATLLNELYAPHIANVAGYVAELNPALSPGARQQRAAMIAAMIDGMMLMIFEADARLAPGQPEIGIEMRKQLLRIATDP